MLAGIRDFIIITTPNEQWTIRSLFVNAKKELGIELTVLVQLAPTGIPDAFNIVKEYLGEAVYDYDNHALILGDNIFYSGGLTGVLRSVVPNQANIFLYPVKNPSDFGIAKTDSSSRVISLEEKPTNPKSNLAVTGLYFYPPSVYLYARQLVPSKRGELEITDLNNLYLKNKELLAVTLPRGTVWFDTGNPDAMLEAANFVQTIQKHQSYLIGSPHEIAINSKWVTNEDVQPFIDVCKKTHYGQYLRQMLQL
jgi:glucose-1-phosphate thymidylyltransferase